jgi:uncharacterized membrane protein YidH (DUF202 family)
MNQPKKSTSADSSNAQRDHLANVRTMLSWVRTAVTIMGLGFVVAKFGLVLDELPGHHHTLGIHLAAAIGVSLVVAAAAILAVAVVEFVAVNRAIRSGGIYIKSVGATDTEHTAGGRGWDPGYLPGGNSVGCYRPSLPMNTPLAKTKAPPTTT